MSNAIHAALGLLLLSGTGWLPTTRQDRDSIVDPSAEAQLSRLVEKYEGARQALFRRMDAAQSGNERANIYLAADWEPFLEEFSALAYEHAGSDAAAQAWIWIVRIGREDHVARATEAVNVVAIDHLESEVLGELVRELRHPGRLDPRFVRETLSSIRAGPPHQSVQAAAQFCWARSLLGEGAEEADEAAGRELLDGIVADYADVEAAAKDARRLLFELDHLQVGMRAPDFEAVDQDGASFRLSDYLGKVVVIDFWGFW